MEDHNCGSQCIVLIHSEQKIYTVSLTLTCDLELKIPQAMVPFDRQQEI